LPLLLGKVLMLMPQQLLVSMNRHHRQQQKLYRTRQLHNSSSSRHWHMCLLKVVCWSSSNSSSSSRRVLQVRPCHLHWVLRHLTHPALLLLLATVLAATAQWLSSNSGSSRLQQVSKARSWIRQAPLAQHHHQQQQQQVLVCQVVWLLHLLPCSCWQQHCQGHLLVVEPPLLLLQLAVSQAIHQSMWRQAQQQQQQKQKQRHCL
jgi:hypothetical protein